MMKKIITISSLTFILLFFIVSHQSGATVSYFSDFEISEGSSLQAALLDFVVDETLDIPIEIAAPTTPVIIPIIIPEQGSLPIEYIIKTSQTSGDINFCSQLTTPQGPFLSFVTASSTSMDLWSLELSLASTSTGIHFGDACSVDLVYFGWHDGDDGFGYNDEEKITLNIHSISTSTDLIEVPEEPILPLTELDFKIEVASTTATTTDEGLVKNEDKKVKEDHVKKVEKDKDKDENKNEDQNEQQEEKHEEQATTTPEVVEEESTPPVEEVVVEEVIEETPPTEESVVVEQSVVEQEEEQVVEPEPEPIVELEAEAAPETPAESESAPEVAE